MDIKNFEKAQRLNQTRRELVNELEQWQKHITKIGNLSYKDWCGGHSYPDHYDIGRYGGFSLVPDFMFQKFRADVIDHLTGQISAIDEKFKQL